jgi:hypothetical protein
VFTGAQEQGPPFDHLTTALDLENPPAGQQTREPGFRIETSSSDVTAAAAQDRQR